MFRWISTVETKVWAAVAGTGAGVTVSAVAVWFVGLFISHVPPDSAHAEQAIASVPAVLVAFIGLAVTALGTLIGGYAAPASNHAGNALTGIAMDDTAAGHDDFPDPAAVALSDGALSDGALDDTAQEG